MRVIITRHQGLVEWLEERGIVGEVIAHADEQTVKGKHTYGVLPLSLAVHTASHTEVAMRLPQELRGVELTKEQVEEYNQGMVTYSVTRI